MKTFLVALLSKIVILWRWLMSPFESSPIIYVKSRKRWNSGFCEDCGSLQDYLETHPGDKVVDCEGCNGTGKVTYGPDHPLVKQFGCEPGTYTCPYCGGSGKLIEES